MLLIVGGRIPRGGRAPRYGLQRLAAALCALLVARVAWAFAFGFGDHGYLGLAVVPSVMLRIWTVACEPHRLSVWFVVGAFLAALLPVPMSWWFGVGACPSLLLMGAAAWWELRRRPDPHGR